MKEPLHIREQRLIDKAFEKMNKLDILEERGRFVIFEKYIIPTVVGSDEEQVLEYELANFTFRGDSYAEISWYNSSGYLHSFNDMPSKITFGTYHWLTVEWHKNGIPYRKNFMPNFIEVKSDRYFFTNSDKPKLITTYTWLNQRGEPHSFNDMPGKISDSSIEWYWNGNNQRRSSNIGMELPCSITSLGHMRFCRGKNDSPESVNYPLSTKHFGKAALYNLNHYERYVKWPIRKLLTL
jgi:hypothetical protein